MKERPILFNSEMVRAILDGRKTMTRRVIKPQPVPWVNRVNYVGGDDLPWAFLGENGAHAGFDKCPYGQPGDLLWVRETFGVITQPLTGEKSVIYKATHKQEFPNEQLGFDGSKWKSSRFMPRWASRITLRVLDVRVERVQEITEADAHHEGWFYQNHPLDKRYDPVTMDTARQWFLGLWDSINAKRGYSWDSNPWVWVVSFEVVK